MASVNIRGEELFDDVWREWVSRGGPALEEAAREEVGVDTGELQDSIEFVTTGPRSGKLVATASHASLHIEGHGEIRPNDPDGVLSWLDKFSGSRVFAKVVGPVAGNPFLQNAVRKIGLKLR